MINIPARGKQNGKQIMYYLMQGFCLWGLAFSHMIK